MKRKGFTLIELLAVIVILAVIALITIPLIGNIIEDSKKKALEQSVYGIVDAANYFTISNDGVYEFLFNENKKGETEEGNYSLNYKGQVDANGRLYIDNDGNISLCLMNDNYYVYKNYNGGIYIGNRTESDCAIKYDILTNKYISYLNDGTSSTSNVYTKEEVDTKIAKLNETLTNYVLKTDFDILTTIVNGNTNSIEEIKNSSTGSLNMRYNKENDMVQLYSDGEWINWKSGGLLFDGYYYNYGDERINITDEWIPWIYNDSATANKNSDSLYFGSSTTSYLGGFRTNQKIDFTNIDTLLVTCSLDSSSYGMVVGLTLHDMPTDSQPATNFSHSIQCTSTTPTTLTMDVSSINGEYYIAAAIRNNYAKIYSIYIDGY